MTTKKTLLAGMAAFALGLAVTGNAWAETDWNLDDSLEANDNAGAVAQEDSEAELLSGTGAFALDNSDAEYFNGEGTTAQGDNSEALAGDGNIAVDSEAVQAGADGNAISAEDSVTAAEDSTALKAGSGGSIANDSSEVVDLDDIDAFADGEGSEALHDAAMGGNASTVIGENDGVIATTNALGADNDDESFTAANNSTGVMAEDSGAVAVNDSTAVEGGGFVGGSGIATGEDFAGAIATGEGSMAVAEADDSFNYYDEMEAESLAELEQITTETSMYADAGDLDGGSTGSASGGTLTTGSITASDVTGNLGVTSANMNTGLTNQGAAIGVAAVASTTP